MSQLNKWWARGTEASQSVTKHFDAKKCLRLLEVKLVGVWVPDLCFPHPCNRRSFLKDPPVDGKELNARLPGAEEGL